MKISTIGIDLAKALFQVHAIDQYGKAVQMKKHRRGHLVAYFANNGYPLR